MHGRRALAIVLMLNVIMAGLALTAPRAVGAADSTVVVTPSSLAATGWQIQDLSCDDTPATGTTTFVAGPGTPPRGAGSVQFAVGDGPDAYDVVGNNNYLGTPLAALSALSYSLHVVSADSPGIAPYLSILVDFNDGGATTDDVLYFDPVFQNGTYAGAPAQNGGAVTYGAWQTWNVQAGAIRSRNAGGGNIPTFTLATYAAAHPGATITNETERSGIRIIGGCQGGTTHLIASTDNVTVGVSGNNTIFDFEQDKDLAIAQSATPNPVTAGTNLTYTITVINSGPGVAQAAVVTDNLPNGTTYFSCTASNGGVCGGAGNSRTITFGTLPAGSSATIFLLATVDGTVPDATTLSNTASVAAYGGETNPANNAATAAVTVSNPTVPAATQHTVAASFTGPGLIAPTGTTAYGSGSQASYTATPTGNAVFLGWTLDGQYVGYASPLTFAVNADRTLVAAFAARPAFADVPTSDPDYQAITFLAAAGIINPAGVNGSGNFEPDRDVQRAEIAAFIARTFHWDTEFHANGFPDKCDPQGQNCIDDELWNNVAALADYGVVGGYTDPATCGTAGATAPCYLPRDIVQRVQVASIVARAFIKQPDLRTTGFWDRQGANEAQYTNVPNAGTQRSDLTTYRANAGPIPGQASDTTFPNPAGNGSRRFIIQVLYQAFNAQFSVDNTP